MKEIQKWEYYTIKREPKGFFSGKPSLQDFDSELNRLGEDGWELVSCFTTEQSGYTYEFIAVLKRPKE